MGTVLGRRIRQSTYTDNRHEAEANMIARLAALKAEAVGVVRKKTFKNAVEAYLADEQRSEGTKWALGRLVQFFGPNLLCEEITQKMLSRARARLCEAGSGLQTFKRTTVVPVRAALTWASHEWGERYGCPQARFRPIKGGGRRNEVLAPGEMETLIALAREKGWSRFASTLAFDWATGARASELFNLREGR